jgi:hypothetical protein
MLVLKPMFHGTRVTLADDAAVMTPAELHAEAIEHIDALRTQVAAIARQPLTQLFRWLPLSALFQLRMGHLPYLCSCTRCSTPLAMLQYLV